MAQPWTEPELAAIRPRRAAATIARETGRTESAVKRKAKSLGVPLRGTKASRRPAAPPRKKQAAPPRPLMSAAGCASPELVKAFIETHLKLVEREFFGQPFVLEDWQIDDLIEPVFGTLRSDGSRLIDEVLWGLPRDAGKSEISAAIALALMFLEVVPRGKYVVIARNREQAGLLFDKAKYMVLSNPRLKAACDVRAKEIIVKETGQKFYTLPWDDGAAQAIHARLVIIDEYHVHRNSSVYYAARSGQTHEPNSLLITISTAGAKRKGPLWDLIRSMPASGKIDGSRYMYWVGAPDDADPADPATWMQANPQSWSTEESLRKAFESMPLWEFERYHLNRFPQAEGSIQAFTWAAVEQNIGVPDIDPTRAVVIGIDAAPLRDRCALVMAQRDAEGQHHWQAWIWQPGRQMEFGDFEAIEQQIRELAEMGFYLARIVADQSFLFLALNHLKAEGYPVETMRQDNTHMCGVAGVLHKLLTAGMVHFDDERVQGDLLNVSVEERPPWGWRMGKLDDEGYIDSAIAGGMASFLLETDELLMDTGPPVMVG